MEQEITLGDATWKFLLKQVYDKKCIPFLGAGASVQWFPLAKDIAKKWAEKYEYPLEDKYSLSNVAQYLAIFKGDDSYPNILLVKN